MKPSTKAYLQFILVIIIALCFIIAVAVAAASGTSSNYASYTAAWVIFLFLGLSSLGWLGTLLYPTSKRLEKLRNF